MTTGTTVLLVDDHAIMRDGVRSIIEHSESLAVVGECDNGWDAIELASRHVPDIVLMDIGMPGLNGVEATRKIQALKLRIAVIALSMYSDERYVTRMLDAGARGYLLKTCPGDELLRAIAAVLKGRLYVTADLTHVLVDRFHSSGKRGTRTGTPPLDVLTPREREVLQLIAEGLTSKEIAARIGAALKTVESHRSNLIQKLDLHSIAELTKYAIREGLTGLMT